MSVGPLVLDHLAIGCATLEQGAAYIRERLGVEMPFGGKHERMGTHNRLMRLGDTYLELIAIDPDAPPPSRPRWFALDEAWQQQRIGTQPRPIAWIARGVNICDALAATPELGKPVEMTRGDLAWQISLRDDGVLPERGLLPVLIAWPDGLPLARIADLGVSLVAVRLVTAAQADLAAALARIGARELVELAPADGEERIEIDLRLASGTIVTLR